jgi:regulator of protease activity HflC (stomatin/prohibitin superfamily)
MEGPMFLLSSLVNLVPLIVVVIFVSATSVRIVQEYERIVVFRLGRVREAKGPGLVFIIPWVDRIVRVDLRTITLDVPAQEVITRDNVPAKVNAVCYYRVIDPVKTVIQVQSYNFAISQIAQTSLRSVAGQCELDEILSAREKINTRLQQIIDQQTEPWGIKVTIVELKDVQIPEQMQRAIAHQAEAERDRRAKIINAEGEFQAAQKLLEAAQVIAKEPIALQLRYLQTMVEISGEQNTTTFFPLPMEFLKSMFKPS